MKLPQSMRFLQISFVVLILCLAFSISSTAQKKKSVPAAKKSEVATKDANKDSKSAKNRKTEKDSKLAKNDPKAKTENSKTKNLKNQKDVKNSKEAEKQTVARKAEEARKQAEQRKAEEARRQAALAEQRRREQARREAAARKAAFERGLRDETVRNILEDDTEGEDLQIRRVAVEALGSRAGTVVVMEAQTGKVLTVVNQNWGVKKGFKPCSTIKLVTGAAGVNENLIDDEGNLKRQSFRLNLDDAIAHSNNSYFQKVGTNLGSDKMVSYARALGLGEPTGFNSEGETAGRVPNGNNNPRIYSHGDDFEVTPLQLAVMVSAITNGGKIVIPRTPRSKVEKAKFQGYMRREVKISQETLQNLIPGMIGATEYGTAKRASTAGLNVAGKTGSCIFGNTWVGLFASIAPAVNPKYSVVVITRGQSERGKYASAVAGKIYQALAPRFNKDEREMLTKIPLKLKPQQKFNAQRSAQFDNEEGEDSDDGDVIKTKIKNPKKGENQKTEEMIDEPETQTFQKEAANKPPVKKFDPVVIEFNREGAEKSPESPKRSTRPRVVNN